jgi:circadian clock protein KaiC
MKNRRPRVAALPKGVEKAPTGIQGLDEITGGGLPLRRPTLVCGGPGCGKTLMGIEFLVHGAIDYDEPGVFLAFEETEEELARNVATLGFDLNRLAAQKKVRTEFIRVERHEIEETGEYNLEGLFIRIGAAIDAIHAKRVVLDTIEVLFAGLTNHGIVRAELRRLFRWLKDKGVTAVITGERGREMLTRYGLEEYVADCVIVLDNRMADQISTRRLRIVKYRGSGHGNNEYPFLITSRGLSVLPVTSLGLDHEASTKRTSSGVPRLDTLLGGLGYYRGSSVLISGSAGTGKSTLAVAFAAAACQRGERCLYLAFEESQSQILRNMRSVGYHLEPLVKRDLLRFHAARPTCQGLESHLATIHDLVTSFKPAAVVLDPVTNLTTIGSQMDVKSMLARIIDFLKSKQVTLVATSLTAGGDDEQQSEVGISSLMDTWILVRNLEANGERNRGLFILKSRGMAHSNQVREFVLSDKGIHLVDVYTGQGTVLAGSARVAQVARERAEEALAQQEMQVQCAAAEERRASAAAQIAALQVQMRAAEEELKRLAMAAALRDNSVVLSRAAISRSRFADKDIAGNAGGAHVH